MAVSDDVRKSVVFLAKAVPPKDGNPTNEIEYGGTGFLVSYQDGDGIWSRYLVTCRHVAEQLDVDFYMRLNTVGGSVELAPVEQANWQYHDDKTVDIAATSIGLNANYFDHLALPLSMRASKDQHFGCGQRVHIVGLFRLHMGSKRNVPIVHTGHIAALPDPAEKIPLTNEATGQTDLVESYLVEAQTLKGLSGSPVFVHEYAMISEKPMVLTFGDMKLLGVYQGAWDGRPGKILADDRNLSGGQRVPLGMGMVVPIERVMELIEGNAQMKKWREEIRQRELSKRAATTDSAFSPAST
jgi:hypothetical protein